MWHEQQRATSSTSQTNTNKKQIHRNFKEEENMTERRCEHPEVVPSCATVQNFCPCDFRRCTWTGSPRWVNMTAHLARLPFSVAALVRPRSSTPAAPFSLTTRDPLLVGLTATFGHGLESREFGMASGGLGARSVADQAPAAYVASLAQTEDLYAPLSVFTRPKSRPLHATIFSNRTLSPGITRSTSVLAAYLWSTFLSNSVDIHIPFPSLPGQPPENATDAPLV